MYSNSYNYCNMDMDIMTNMMLTYSWLILITVPLFTVCEVVHIAHLQHRFHNWKCVIFQERLLKVLRCYNFLWVQRRHNCSLAASFANCVMTLYLLKVHLQTFLSIPITQKMSNFELWHSCCKLAICGHVTSRRIKSLCHVVICPV